MASLSVEGDGGAANDFSGSGESVVQAGTVHSVHFHNAGRPHSMPPRQLPGGIGGFVNRLSSLAQLDSLLGSSTAAHRPPSAPHVVVIVGAPGVGKTALALHWAHLVREHFPDGELYIDMRGYGADHPLGPEQAIDVFLRSLNVAPDRIPIDLEERASLYRSILGDKKMLIVLDNASSAKQIRQLLPGSRDSLVLVTSRSRISGLVVREGAIRMSLDVLSSNDSVRLLAEIIGEDRVDAEIRSAEQVAVLCGFLPLALRVVAERTAGRPHMRLSELVNELNGEQSRLDALAAEVDELTDVRAAFSWSYRALAHEHRHIFRMLALHPGPEFCCSVVAALVDVPEAELKPQLEVLVGVHLLQQISPDRYRIHDLLRAYSVERSNHELAQRDRTYAMRRMLSWYLIGTDNARQLMVPYSRAVSLVPAGRIDAPSFSTLQDVINWFESERLNLLAALHQAMELGQFDIAWKLPVVADAFFEMRSYWKEWRQIHVDGVSAARMIGDDLGEAANLICLGDAMWRLGEHEDALTTYEQSSRIAHEIGDRRTEGYALRGSGLICYEIADYDRALQLFENALEVFRASSVKRGEAMSLLSLGTTFKMLGRMDDAVRHCEEAVEILRDIDDVWSVAWALMPLAEALGSAGRFSESEGQLAEAVEIFRRFDDRNSEAMAWEHLGDVLASQRKSDAAIAAWSKSFEILESLGNSRSREVGQKIEGLQG
ncbi:tetratricopeptide repeat protein [Umezawaea endophytica]|uniref:Tetratricopeptide repeat protein n=1 Tax=Umezawaea endophytica TaxID=1654476 RepID=A0A9X2VWB8_9PSEU|nr:tetratricopeptide repeat protein [Umezawaea endophytica]MCS7483875.1 tetratricopeptide repeat protein [Umezawaea endophytica]